MQEHECQALCTKECNLCHELLADLYLLTYELSVPEGHRVYAAYALASRAGSNNP